VTRAAAFASERAKALLVRLGMKENERIDHPWVTRSLRRSQQKIARKVPVEQKASSPEEWFEKNYQR